MTAANTAIAALNADIDTLKAAQAAGDKTAAKTAIEQARRDAHAARDAVRAALDALASTGGAGDTPATTAETTPAPAPGI